jgi:hypothetical protein
MRHACLEQRSPGAGTATVEFAVVVTIFLVFIFATMELARVEYLVNTLPEVTRRAAAGAAHTNFRDNAALDAVRADAVFRTSGGGLVLGDPVGSANVTIDYLSVASGSLELRHVTALPSCPARNRWNCMADPNADNCIRFVRARICQSIDGAGACTPLPYQKVFPFLDLSRWKIPVAETIVPAGSLGYTAGSMPCP